MVVKALSEIVGRNTRCCQVRFGLDNLLHADPNKYASLVFHHLFYDLSNPLSPKLKNWDPISLNHSEVTFKSI